MVLIQVDWLELASGGILLLHLLNGGLEFNFYLNKYQFINKFPLSVPLFFNCKIVRDV